MKTIDRKPIEVWFEQWALDENGDPLTDPVAEWIDWTNEIDTTNVSINRACDEWWKLSWKSDGGGFYDCIITCADWEMDDLKEMENGWVHRKINWHEIKNEPAWVEYGKPSQGVWGIASELYKNGWIDDDHFQFFATEEERDKVMDGEE